MVLLAQRESWARISWTPLTCVKFPALMEEYLVAWGVGRGKYSGHNKTKLFKTRNKSIQRHCVRIWATISNSAIGLQLGPACLYWLGWPMYGAVVTEGHEELWNEESDILICPQVSSSSYTSLLFIFFLRISSSSYHSGSISRPFCSICYSFSDSLLLPYTAANTLVDPG